MKKIILVSICLMIFSCKKENTSANSVLSVGQNYGGGIIFYIDGTGEHGLIAATSDQSDSVQWYNGTYITTNTFEGEVGKGKPNTNAIVNVQGNGIYAASLCDQLVLNGFSDWFLPSKSELNLLYQKRNLVGGFANDYYWSSPEYDTLKAWNQYFPFGVQYYADKSSMAHVRAIRAF